MTGGENGEGGNNNHVEPASHRIHVDFFLLVTFLPAEIGGARAS
jgi:hypothetical protein